MIGFLVATSFITFYQTKNIAFLIAGLLSLLVMCCEIYFITKGKKSHKKARGKK